MSYRSKKDFIRQNQQLSLEELSRRTGLSDRQVRKIREQFAVETKTGARGMSKALSIENLWLVALIPVLLTFFFYLPVLSNSFVNWDDSEGIVQNLHIRHLDGTFIHWMFTTFQTGNWMPLTWLSFAIDYRLGRLDPMVYHLDNLLLHSLNTFLVFFLSLKVLNSVTRNDDQKK